MTKDKIHFITYGDEKFTNSKKRIFNEALNTNWFETITIYEPKDIDDEHKKEFEDVYKYSHGDGYYLWKIYIVLKSLEKINDKDFLVYIDSGCKINKNGEKRFYEYIDLIKDNTNKIISFYLSWSKEREWTTKQLFDAFDLTTESYIAKSCQHIGGILIMQKCKKTIEIFKLAMEIIREDHKLITDYYNKTDQISIFKENRHDQSILSIIRKLKGSILIKDETNSTHKKKHILPFQASRLRN